MTQDQPHDGEGQDVRILTEDEAVQLGSQCLTENEIRALYRGGMRRLPDGIWNHADITPTPSREATR